MAVRIGLERPTADFLVLPLPPNIHIGTLPAPEVLAPVMLTAYEGTPDYEGETLDETVGELREVLDGKYGAVITAASFVAYDGEAPVAAITTVTEDELPLVALVFTLPNYGGNGIASALLAAAAASLHDAGHPIIRLAVNPDNLRAVRLYRHLGFVKTV